MSESKYLKDNLVENDNKGVVGFDTMLMAGITIAGAKKMHDSGLLKSTILKVAKKINDGSFDKITTLHETRAWLSSNNMNTERSILRSGALRRIMSMSDKKELKKIYESTLYDAKIISKIIKKETDEGAKLLKKYHKNNTEANFELFQELAYGNSAINDMVSKHSIAKKSMQGLIYDDIISRYNLSTESANESIRKNGYKIATVGDLFKYDIDKNGNIKLISNGKVKDLNPIYANKNKKEVSYFEAMLNGYVVNVKGKTKSKNGKTIRRYEDIYFKNLIIDKNIKISESGEVLDLRRFNADNVHSVRALATEFKIPVLGINPLKMIGLDKFGKKNPKYGYIGEDVVAPAITGMRGNSIHHTIRAAKEAGNSKLKDADSGVMIINGDVYKTVNGKVEKIHYNSKKEVHISYLNQGQSGFEDINQLEYSQLKMMGISNVESSSFSNGDTIVNKIFNAIDIGQQDKVSKVENSTAFNYLDPDNMIGNGIASFINKISKRDVKHYQKAHEMIYKDGSSGKYGTLFVTNKATSVFDVIKSPKDQDTMYRFLDQFVADFNKNPDSVTSVTAIPHFLVDRLSSTIGNVGLGLSEANNSGPFNRMFDMITKRVLPIFSVYAGWQALNMVTEGADENGQRTNLNRGIMELYASIDTGLAAINETIGGTKVAKNIKELLPGFDQISELPGLNLLHLDQTAKERQDYWEHGKDAIRKGRYWSLSSNVSYTGGKIDYYRMNPLQRTKADARFSDSLFGSRKEYITNILNPYHYDLKHFYDRPYLQTSPAFENVPVFGEFLSGTIGKVVKPVVKMHKEYWNYNSPYMSHEINQLGINESIEESRKVSQNVSDVLNNKASEITKDIYKNNFFKDLVNNINSSIRKSLRPSSDIPYEYRASSIGNTDTEKSTVIATEPYSRSILRRELDYIIDKNYDTFLNAYYSSDKQKEFFYNNLFTNGKYQSIGELGSKLLPNNNDKYYDISHYMNNNDIARMNDLSSSISDYIYNLNYNNIYNNKLAKYISDKYYSSSLSFQEYKPYNQSQELFDKKTYEEYKNIGIPTGLKYDYKKYAKIDKQFDLSNQFFVYRTGSGNFKVVNSGDEIDPLIRVNQDGDSVDSFTGDTSSKIQYSYITDDYITYLKERKMLKPNGFEHTIRNTIADASNVAGIYGYGVSSLFIGDTQKDTTVLETASYSRSLNKLFWDQDLGGLSGDISEIFRRFVQKRKEYGVEYFNPIRNTMPEWLPGIDGFIDFQHGDPYSKIKNGEERLPGHGYERAYGIDIDDYKITSSKIGGDVNSMIKYFLGRDGITDENAQSIVKKGTKMHEMVEGYMQKHYISIDTEKEVWDRENNISGIYDARIVDYTSKTGEAIVDIKTISQKGFDEVVKTSKPKEEHVKQVNFYLHNTNKDNNGGVLYVNRDNPSQMYMTTFKYSKSLYDEVINNVNQARQEVKSAIDSGQISRAERYKPIDKFRILADVAPYSREYNDMKTYLSSLNLTGSAKEEFDRIKERVSNQRRQLRTYEYKFKTADIVTKVGTVDTNMGDNMFKIHGSDNPIKFAGIKIKTLDDFINEGLTNSQAKEKVDELNQFIDKQMKGVITFKVAEDKYHRVNKDTYNTMDAIIYSKGKNLNKLLIKKGYAVEDTEDFSAPGVHVRFNALERLVGSSWETIAHQNTIVNNRILRVRSAKEEYERQMTYGVDFKSWTRPVEDFIKPMIWQGGREESIESRVMAGMAIGFVGAMAGRNIGKVKLKELPIKSLKYSKIGDISMHASVIGAVAGTVGGGAIGGSIILGGVIGGAFGGVGKRGTFGRLLGASMGVSTVIGAKVYRSNYEKESQRTWAPKEKREQAAIVEYIDKIKYVRNRRLFEIYVKKALIEDGIDVKKMINDSKNKAKKQKDFSKKMSKIKVKQRKKGYFDINEYKKNGLKLNKESSKNVKKFIEPISKDFKEPKDTRFQMFLRAKKYLQNPNENMNIKDTIDYIVNGSKEEQISNKQNIKKIKQYRKRHKEELEKAYKRKRRLLTKQVNDAINTPTNSKELTATSYNTMKALEYYGESEKTLYAYDPGDSLTDFVNALPKKDRKFFNEFLKAGEKEREEILKITPRYMTRALQAAYGKEVQQKEDLTQYFNRHYLPDEDWVGWQEGYDFNVVETKILKKADVPLTEHGKWDDDIKRANAYGEMPIPNIHYKTSNISAIKQKLTRVLGDAGYEDIEVDVLSTNRKSSINLNIVESRANKLRNKLNERMMNDERQY